MLLEDHKVYDMVTAVHARSFHGNYDELCGEIWIGHKRLVSFTFTLPTFILQQHPTHCAPHRYARSWMMAVESVRVLLPGALMLIYNMLVAMADGRQANKAGQQAGNCG